MEDQPQENNVAQPQQTPEIKKEEPAAKQKNSYKYLIWGIIAVILIAGIYFYMKNQEKISAQEAPAAIVNGEIIKMTELDSLYNSIPAQYKLFTNRGSLLDSLIEREIVYQEAKKQGIKIDRKEAEKYVNQAKLSSGLTDEQFAQKLKEQNRTEEELVEDYMEQLIIKGFIDKTILSTIQITDEEINKYYNENKVQFKIGQQVTARHVLIGDTDLSAEEQEAKAKSLLAEITKDNFCDYVEKYSTDKASVPNCGEYTFTKDDAYVQEFKDLAFEQNPGQIGTVKTQFGAHILWTVKKNPPKTLSLKEATESITNLLKDQKAKEKYQIFYQQLKQKSTIEIKYVETAVKQGSPTPTA